MFCKWRRRGYVPPAGPVRSTTLLNLTDVSQRSLETRPRLIHGQFSVRDAVFAVERNRGFATITEQMKKERKKKKKFDTCNT